MKAYHVNRRSLLIGLAAAPAIVRAAHAAPMAICSLHPLPNNPKFANGRVYYDNLVKAPRDTRPRGSHRCAIFPRQSAWTRDRYRQFRQPWRDRSHGHGHFNLGKCCASDRSARPRLSLRKLLHRLGACRAGAAKPLEQALRTGANVQIIGWAYNFGSRSVMCKSRVNAPADLAGKRIRTLPNKIITECLKLMGAAATPMAFGEIYTALQAGVLDGLEHDPPTVAASKFYEAAKFYSLTQHNFSALGVFCSGLTLNSNGRPRCATSF